MHCVIFSQTLPAGGNTMLCPMWALGIVLPAPLQWLFPSLGVLFSSSCADRDPDEDQRGHFRSFHDSVPVKVSPLLSSALQIPAALASPSSVFSTRGTSGLYQGHSSVALLWHENCLQALSWAIFRVISSTSLASKMTVLCAYCPVSKIPFLTHFVWVVVVVFLLLLKVGERIWSPWVHHAHSWFFTGDKNSPKSSTHFSYF